MLVHCQRIYYEFFGLSLWHTNFSQEVNRGRRPREKIKQIKERCSGYACVGCCHAQELGSECIHIVLVHINWVLQLEMFKYVQNICTHKCQ